MKRIIYFITTYIILASLFFVFLSIEKENKLNQHLDKITNDNVQDYAVLYDKYKKLSTIIFETKIDTKDVKDIFKNATTDSKEKKSIVRKKLYAKLKDTYSLLLNYNIKQLHFHLPSNESFLRFHRPKRFGDDLSNVRATVSYVNQFKKPISGFEEGKIYNGYRYVFPLFDDKKYLGSVEISFSVLAMSLEFTNYYNRISNFLILKTVTDKKVFKDELDNYKNSPFEKFYLDKASTDTIRKLHNIQKPKLFTKKTLKIVNDRAYDNTTFSFYDDKRKEIFTFIKVQNEITKEPIGMFVIRTNGQYIINKTRNFQTTYFVLIVLLAIIFYFLYKDLIYRSSIKEQNLLLEQRVKDEVSKSREKDDQIMQQSKLAQMGEMISMIAHQWRQPLGSISSAIIGLKLQLQTKRVDFTDSLSVEKYLKDINAKYDDISEYTQVLSSTIDDFRNFFKEDNQKEKVSLTTPINRALHIVQNSMKSKGIEIVTDFKCDETIEIFQNEMMQVVLNILKNSEDNFVEKDIKNAKINIATKKEDGKYIISIKDNGGGIPTDVIDMIFDPYFSTKKDKNGTGIGLYMSKMIVEEHNDGKLECENTTDGVEFRIILQQKVKNV